MKKVISMVCLTVWFLSAVQVFAGECAKGGCCTPKTTASFACVMPGCDPSANTIISPAKGILAQSKVESFQEMTLISLDVVQEEPALLSSPELIFAIGSPPMEDPSYIRYHRLLI
ncbi:MAG: hypothetical protein HYW85_04370 [Deltaproteobacteria bacterium]|nr:hypothetical protein [Deltaproteobacteria bacterium]MBI3017171.1 hypothetical protein [Deltaproteobacteria bacterium]